MDTKVYDIRIENKTIARAKTVVLFVVIVGYFLLGRRFFPTFESAPVIFIFAYAAFGNAIFLRLYNKGTIAIVGDELTLTTNGTTRMIPMIGHDPFKTRAMTRHNRQNLRMILTDTDNQKISIFFVNQSDLLQFSAQVAEVTMPKVMGEVLGDQADAVVEQMKKAMGNRTVDLAAVGQISPFFGLQMLKSMLFPPSTDSGGAAANLMKQPDMAKIFPDREALSVPAVQPVQTEKFGSGPRLVVIIIVLVVGYMVYKQFFS